MAHLLAQIRPGNIPRDSPELQSRRSAEASSTKPIIMQGLRYRPELLEGLPEELTKELKKYEDWFWLDAPKLKTISDHFAKELEKGLTIEGGSVPMNVTWIMKYPTGQEQGRVLTVDLGGTNIRVCDVCLTAGKRDLEQRQRKYKLPEEVKTTTKEALWGFIADQIKSFLSENHSGLSTENPLPMAFTFSFPVEQKSIRSGILQHWTKNFNVSGVNVPVRIVALVNDTAGTLVASHYRDPLVKIGSIFSTGCNAAYMEDCRLIPKLRGSGLPEDATVIINTEYGAFDSERKVLPLTPFDRQLDGESAHPGRQIYEKMVSGLYIGEMLRLVMLRMHEEGMLFKGQDVSRLRTVNSLETSFLSAVEMDMSESLTDVKHVFKKSLNLEVALDELKACRYLIGLISTRAARLYACGIAAICKKKGIRQCHIGVDGTVFSKYNMLKGRAMQGLRDIFDWEGDRLDLIALNTAEDGSGVGAALVAWFLTRVN
ncbi:hypothetical protein PENFLA_c019G06257 [Penicillium flavigenum]|uniref:Phosphotransferase n=1 Tax=Penicillium flavigenum TaxID=254877 RepID=A0A1V6T0B1_9EURO|nr:hypothetical protein PENFLA_c019G06257 [Penicillium flavigenum]